MKRFRFVSILGPALFSVLALVTTGCFSQSGGSGDEESETTVDLSNVVTGEDEFKGARDKAQTVEQLNFRHEDRQGPHPEPWLNVEGPHPEPWLRPPSQSDPDPNPSGKP